MLWAFALGCIAGAARACAGGAKAGSLAGAEGGASLDDDFDAVNGAGLGHGGRRDLLDAADELRGEPLAGTREREPARAPWGLRARAACSRRAPAAEPGAARAPPRPR